MARKSHQSRSATVTRLLQVVLIGAVITLGSLAGCRPRKVTISGGDNDQPESQYTDGLVLYGRHCAQCHEENAAGGDDGPPLVGDQALLPQSTWQGSERKVELHTALDVVRFAKEAMPPLEPGSLPEDKYWAIVAYLLKEGGHSVPAELNAENAANLKLH